MKKGKQEKAVLVRQYKNGYRKKPEGKRETKTAEAALRFSKAHSNSPSLLTFRIFMCQTLIGTTLMPCSHCYLKLLASCE